MFLVIDGWVFHMRGQRGQNCVLNMIESRWVKAGKLGHTKNNNRRISRDHEIS